MREPEYRYWIQYLDNHIEAHFFTLEAIENHRGLNRKALFEAGMKILSRDRCTGRRDKNGGEIAEGDILKDNYGRILLVEWYKQGFSFKALRETNFVRARDISQWFENGERLPKIIGNAFEDSEFIEEMKLQK